MATKKILIQVILDDKASASNKKIGNALGKTTTEFKRMTVEQEKQYIAQQKAIISNKLYTDSLKKQAIKQVDVAEATGNARAQSGLNNAILLETGRLASDASYGFTAMANNLGQIVSLFGSFIETNDGVVASFKQLLKSLWGVGGLLIGIQLLIAFGPKIYDFFTGMTEEMKKAAKAQEELNKSLDDLGNKIFQAQKYADVIENVNTSEEVRLNLTNELINQIPNLTAEDFKYGQNLDEVRGKINEYALSQATRIEIDRLVEVNSETLSAAATVRRISEIKDEEEKTKAMRKFLEQQGMDVDARIRARKVGALKDDLGEGTLAFIGTDAETIAAEFSLMTTEAVLASRIIEEELNELYKNLKRQGDVGKRDVVELLEIFRFGLETNELYLQGFTGQQIMAMEALSEGVRERKKELNDFGDAYIEKAKQITEAEKAETKARIAIREGYFDAAKSISQGFKALGDLDDGFKIAAIITEKAEAIAKVIVKTKESNQIISAAGKARAMLGDPTAIPKSRARRLSNNISAGINIAGIVAAAAGGISAIKSKSSVGASLGGGGEAGEAGEVQAPDFNVVGAGGVSQLATTLAGVTGKPLKAFVVSKEITSAQELERNITDTASVG
jgi:hypothetical protein